MRTASRGERIVVALAAALAAGCGTRTPASSPPQWRLLQRPAPERSSPERSSPERSSLEAVARRFEAAPGPRTFRLADGALAVELVLDPAAWRSEREGTWSTALPEGAGAVPEGARVVLDGLELELGARRTRPCADVRHGRLVVALPPGSPAPGDARLTARWTRVPGRWSAPDDAGRIVEDALDVWPGERFELECAVAPGSVLRFRPRSSALLGAGRVTFRVRADGASVLELAVAAGEPHPAAVVPLPSGPRVRLALEVEGDPAATAFAGAVIGPAEIGAPGARPWPDARPDVVLFVADTFRADLLAAYGGAGDVPALDALAARGRTFLEARSPATWTLPAHASLFSGVWPPQHGAERKDAALPAELDTLAEVLARAGWRTAAVTEGVFVSERHGMDQGFASFSVAGGSREWDLGATLSAAREAVAADDGRPLFLFVHTYRTHTPYRVGPEADATRFRALRLDALRAGDDRGASDDVGSVSPQAVAEARELYREGARALDQELGPFVAGLEAAGLLRDGLLVFTSDHGEEFHEHGGLLHSGMPHDEVARVPLFLLGGRVAPGAVELGASLVDVAPTVAAFCGLAAPATWAGADLLALADERMLFSTAVDGERRLLGVTHGPRKLLAAGLPPLELPRDLAAAHDLLSDPLERADVRAAAPWTAELARAAGAAWTALRDPLARVPRVSFAPAGLEELRELGY